VGSAWKILDRAAKGKKCNFSFCPWQQKEKNVTSPPVPGSKRKKM
jgi:hypothetical protein